MLKKLNTSTGWLADFKDRNDVSFRKAYGERSTVDTAVYDNWREKFSTSIENHEEKDIFSFDKIGLFFK